MTSDPRSAAKALGRAALMAALGLSGATASAASPTPARPVASTPPSRPVPDALPAVSPPLPEQDPASRSVAARARTNECGHQWNNMKRAGTAAGTTWKEFSRGCQAQR